MVYLDNIAGVQEFALPNTYGVNVSQLVKTLTVFSTVDRKTYNVLPTSISAPSPLYWSVRLQLPKALRLPGEYEFTVTAGGRTVAKTVLIIRGNPPETIEHPHEITYKQYGQQ